MCGRFYLDTDFDEIIRKYGLYGFDDTFMRDSGIIRRETLPTLNGLVLHYEPKTDLVKWNDYSFGFRMSGESKGSLLLNARSETVFEKPVYSRLMKCGRCIIPATSFPEWLEEGKKKTRVDFVSRTGLMSLAGLYRMETEVQGSFVIITQQARGKLAEIHDRMPVALDDASLKTWLKGDLTKDDFAQIVSESTDFQWKEEPERQLSFFQP